MAPSLEQVFTLRAYLSPDALPFGSIKGGPQRFIAPVTHGTLEGSGVKAEIIQGGSDWLLLDTTSGVAHLDVRLGFRIAESGEAIYLHYPAILRMDDASQQVFMGSPEAKTTQSKDHYFFCTPVAEVSSERLKWMEKTVFVGHGHWVVPDVGPRAAEYEIYQVNSS